MLRPFNLEEWKSANNPLVTRNGLPLRIISTDRTSPDGMSIVALINDNGEDRASYYYPDGKYLKDEETKYDIMFLDLEEIDAYIVITDRDGKREYSVPFLKLSEACKHIQDDGFAGISKVTIKTSAK